MAKSTPQGATPSGFRGAAMWLSAAAAIVAFLGLLGYLPGLRALASIRPDYIPMAVTTAICFLVLAALVFLQARKPSPRPGRRMAMEVPAILVTLFGLLEVVGSIAGMDLVFEDRLIPETGMLGKIPIGHMSPATGAVFVVAGLGAFLLLLRSRSPRHAQRLGHWAASLGILTILAGATVLLSYLYGAPLLYSGAIVPVAATTAFAFLLLGNALAAAAGPESFPMRLVVGGSTAARLTRVFLPLTVAVVILQGILSRIVPIKPGINHALFLAGLAIAGGTITAILVVRVAHSIGNSLDESNRKLKESEERFRSLYANSPLGLYRTTPDGKIHLANPALIRMLGYSSFADLEKLDLEQGGFAPSHPRARFIEDIERDGAVRGVEYAWKRHDGATIVVRESARAIRDAQGKTLYYDGIVEDITENKQAEAALRESEERYRAIFDTSPDAILLTAPDGRILAVNSATCRLFERSEEEILRSGRNVLLDTSDPKLALALAERERTGKFNGELTFVRKSGVKFPGEISSIIFKDKEGNAKTSMIIRDISERHHAEETLKKSENEFHMLAESMPQIVWITRPDGWNIYFNRQWMAYTGLTLEESYGHGWNKPFHPDDQQMAWDAWQNAVTKNSTYSLECRLRRFDGVYKWWLIRGVPLLDEHGAISKWFGTCTDIDDMKKSELALIESAAEKEVLLKEVHHRIKNNIASIGGLLSMRLQSVRNPEAVAVLQDAIGHVDSMRILYDKLLLTKGYEAVSVKKYVESLADSIIALFPGSASVRVEKRIDDFQLDAKRLFPLGLIINELLTNKMKYAFVGRKSGTIRISLAEENGRVTLVMEDDGVGLPQGFDIAKTNGFGLTLVKMLSQQLGGSFAIESHGQGTRSKIEFTV